MEGFWEFLKVFSIGMFIISALFIILLSLPKSKLRGIVFKIVGIIAYSITFVMALYIVNPIDLIPDFIPILGQVDDAGAVITALFSGVAGVLSFKQSVQELPSRLD